MRQLPCLEIGDVICLLDIDHFNSINERHGHVGGDLVLRDLGRLINANIRGADRAGRYGGDEIVILLRGVPEPVAVKRLSLLQQVLGRRGVAGCAGTSP
jgi:diguanylate cyclase (GGDEF)-like protein